MDQTDAVAVQSVMDHMIEGYRQANKDMILSCYEAGATYVTEPGQAVTGAAALGALFEHTLLMGPDFTFGTHEIAISGDIALHIAKYDARISNDHIHEGMSVAVLRRQGDGGWLMVMDHPSAERLLGL